ncbi:hypothetical protein [Sediminibacterium sp.]|uniref:hypothetical protein n=1 Tax=Sediminibacterium sp. TaxID=1917865 RepID=UPI0027339620|nr:hypothetical protein [Sediminibacterium sp.]MDP3393021.1 hypothetical protein [Sediminibacterium sp.]MDP3567227.1 hypothetical protein [Sediminibacterium sp.]
MIKAAYYAMKKPYVPFLAFLSLLFLTLPLIIDFVTSDIQAWHTTLNPPQFAWKLFVLTLICFMIIGNWLFSNRADKINWILFSFHAFLTLSTVTYLKLPYIFLEITSSNQNDLINSIELRIKFIPIVFVMFFLAQVLLMISFIRTIKKAKIAGE